MSYERIIIRNLIQKQADDGDSDLIDIQTHPIIDWTEEEIERGIPVVSQEQADGSIEWVTPPEAMEELNELREGNEPVAPAPFQPAPYQPPPERVQDPAGRVRTRTRREDRDEGASISSRNMNDRSKLLHSFLNEVEEGLGDKAGNAKINLAMVYDKLLKSGVFKTIGRKTTPEDAEQMLGIYLSGLNPTEFMMSGRTRGEEPTGLDIVNIFTPRAAKTFSDGWDGTYTKESILKGFAYLKKRLSTRVQTKGQSEDARLEDSYDPLPAEEWANAPLEQAGAGAGGRSRGHINMHSWDEIVSAQGHPMIGNFVKRMQTLIEQEADELATAVATINLLTSTGTKKSPILEWVFKIATHNGNMSDYFSPLSQEFGFDLEDKFKNGIPAQLPQVLKTAGKWFYAAGFQVACVEYPWLRNVYVWDPKGGQVCVPPEEQKSENQPMKRFPYNLPKGIRVTKKDIQLDWGSAKFLKKQVEWLVGKIQECEPDDEFSTKTIKYVRTKDFKKFMNDIHGQIRSKVGIINRGRGVSSFRQALDIILGHLSIDTEEPVSSWINPDPIPANLPQENKQWIQSFRAKFVELLGELESAVAAYETQRRIAKKEPEIKDLRKYDALVKKVAFTWLTYESLKP